MKTKDNKLWYPTKKEIIDTFATKYGIEPEHYSKKTLNKLYNNNLINESNKPDYNKLNIFKNNDIPYPLNKIIFTNPKINESDLEKKLIFHNGLNKLKQKGKNIENLNNTDQLIKLILKEEDKEETKKYLDKYNQKDYEEILFYSKDVLENLGIESFTKKELINNNITLDKIIDSIQEVYSKKNKDYLTFKYKTPNNMYVKQSLIENDEGIELYNLKKDKIIYSGPYNDMVIGKVPSRTRLKFNETSLFYVPIIKENRKTEEKELNCYYWRKFFTHSTSEFNQLFPIFERKDKKQKNSSFFINASSTALYTKLIRDLENKDYKIKISPIIFPSNKARKKIDNLRYQSLVYDSIYDKLRPLNKTELETITTKELLKNKKELITNNFI